MTVIIQDATATLSDPAKTAFELGDLSVLLYADDTLIFGKHQGHMQELLNAIATSGGRAGMELHWDKFQVLHVQNDIELYAPSGALIQPKDRLVYLGATISNTGRISGGSIEDWGRRGASSQGIVRFGSALRSVPRESC